MYLQARIHCWLNFTNKCTHWKGFHFFFISIFLIAAIICIGEFFFSYHICLPLLFNSKNYRFCYFENRLYVPAWFSFVHIHSQERLAAVVVLKISDFLNDIFSRETYSLKTTCFVAQYLNYLSTRLKSNCLHVFNQNVRKSLHHNVRWRYNTVKFAGRYLQTIFKIWLYFYMQIVCLLMKNRSEYNKIMSWTNSGFLWSQRTRWKLKILFGKINKHPQRNFVYH